MLNIINEITDDIDKNFVEKITDYKSLCDIHNRWFKDQNNNALNNFTENLLRDLLMRSPVVEFEFRQISNNGFILCDHPLYKCGCLSISNIKNIIDLSGTYENGLKVIANILFPNKDVDYKRENYTHINISPNSTSKEGSRLWSFLSDKFKVPTSSEYVSIFDLINSSLIVTRDVVSNISHNAELIRLIEDKVRSNNDIYELLLYNNLPFSMYETFYVRNTANIKIDIYNMWISYMFDEISLKLKEEKYISAYNGI